MPTYQQAPREVTDLVASVMKKHHPELHELGVTVDVLMAFAVKDKETGEPKGPALKHHGSPALATIAVNSLKNRVNGLADCLITIDGDRWPDLRPEQQAALVDHELTHLVPVCDDEGGPKTDDACRPVLKTRPHDVELGVFWSVVKRHGEHAMESAVYREAHRGFAQLCFPWG